MRMLVAIAAVARILVPALFLLLVPLTTTWAAGGLSVTTPNGGQKWTIGKKYAIKWRKGTAGTSVRISLTKSGRHYQWISKKTHNDGRYTWKIPTSVAVGSAYKIKIKSVKKKKVLDSSDRYLTIRLSGTKKSRVMSSSSAKASRFERLKIIRPATGVRWNINASRDVRWSGDWGRGSSENRYVRLWLLKNGRAFKRITAKKTNTGRRSWTPKYIECPGTSYSQYSDKCLSGVTPGNRYQIKIIVNGDNRNSHVSGYFTITNNPVSQRPAVIYPNGGEKWTTGKKYIINWDWESGGNFEKRNVAISLTKSGRHYKWITKKTLHDGAYAWKIPASVSAGRNYKIKIKGRGSGRISWYIWISDSSNRYFTIKKGSSPPGVNPPGTAPPSDR